MSFIYIYKLKLSSECPYGQCSTYSQIIINKLFYDCRLYCEINFVDISFVWLTNIVDIYVNCITGTDIMFKNLNEMHSIHQNILWLKWHRPHSLAENVKIIK